MFCFIFVASIIFPIMVLWISLLYRRKRNSICMQVADTSLFKMANNRVYCGASPLLYSILLFAYAWIIACYVVFATVFLHSYEEWEYISAAPGIIAGDIIIVVLFGIITLYPFGYLFTSSLYKCKTVINREGSFDYSDVHNPLLVYLFSYDFLKI